MKKTLRKLKKAIKKFPQAKNLYNFEKKQASENFRKGRQEGIKEKDTWHAVLIWAVALGFFVLGFYFASLYLLANFCN